MISKATSQVDHSCNRDSRMDLAEYEKALCFAKSEMNEDFEDEVFDSIMSARKTIH